MRLVCVSLVRSVRCGRLEMNGDANAARDRRVPTCGWVERPAADCPHGLGVEIQPGRVLDDDVRNVARGRHRDPEDHRRVQPLLFASRGVLGRRRGEQVRRMELLLLRVRGRVGGRVGAGVGRRIRFDPAVGLAFRGLRAHGNARPEDAYPEHDDAPRVSTIPFHSLPLPAAL